MGIIWDTVAIYWNIFLQQMETERKIPKKILVGQWESHKELVT